MSLLSLPPELLMLLPGRLHNIEDFTNLSSTCRTLHQALLHTSPSTILRLAAAQSKTFFRPHPHFLVAATARQLSGWALQNNTNYEDLREAFHGGMETLLDLCVAHCRLSMDDIRRLHLARMSTINPARDMIDRCADKQWCDVPNFWYGGPTATNAIQVESERSVFQIIIYGELFSSTMDAILDIPGSSKLKFDLDMRLDFIKYCIPDYMCWLGYDAGEEGTFAIHCLPVGPYKPRKGSDSMTEEELAAAPENNRRDLYGEALRDLPPDQVSLKHILTCRPWREAWEGVRQEIGEDFEEGWRQKLWHAAVQLQGLEGLEMLKPKGKNEKWRRRLEEIRDGVRGMQASAEPRVFRFGKGGQEATEAPNLADEIHVCMAGLWSSA